MESSGIKWNQVKSIQDQWNQVESRQDQYKIK